MDALFWNRESARCFSGRAHCLPIDLSKAKWGGGLLVDDRRLVKLPLEVHEALVFRLGHRQGRVHHDHRAHRGVAGERPVKPSVEQDSGRSRAVSSNYCKVMNND